MRTLLPLVVITLGLAAPVSAAVDRDDLYDYRIYVNEVTTVYVVEVVYSHRTDVLEFDDPGEALETLDRYEGFIDDQTDETWPFIEDVVPTTRTEVGNTQWITTTDTLAEANQIVLQFLLDEGVEYRTRIEPITDRRIRSVLRFRRPTVPRAVPLPSPGLVPSLK